MTSKLNEKTILAERLKQTSRQQGALNYLRDILVPSRKKLEGLND